MNPAAGALLAGTPEAKVAAMKAHAKVAATKAKMQQKKLHEKSKLVAAKAKVGTKKTAMKTGMGMRGRGAGMGMGMGGMGTEEDLETLQSLVRGI